MRYARTFTGVRVAVGDVPNFPTQFGEIIPVQMEITWKDGGTFVKISGPIEGLEGSYQDWYANDSADWPDWVHTLVTLYAPGDQEVAEA